jgi:AcrR family transcriptional regulator
MNPQMMSTRAALLESAVTLIRRTGSAREVTVRRIVGGAQANLNAVNDHFGSKQDLVREAVRAIIGDYLRARAMPPGSTGPALCPNLVRICDFLVDEPVAAALALGSELDPGGGGQSLTGETMSAVAEMVRHADPSLAGEDVRLRVWTITAVVHQCFLRPEGCAEWLAIDPRRKEQRDALLARLCALAGVPAEA